MSASHSPVLAVVGGGQLARMMQEEAAALGIHLRALVEAPDGSAAQVLVDAPVGRADDATAVRALLSGREQDTGQDGARAPAAGPGGQDREPHDPQVGQSARLQGRVAAHALTFEHEHQDHELLVALETEGVAVHPSPRALTLAQDKLAMRRALDAVGLPQPAWTELRGDLETMQDQLRRFARAQGWPVVLKTPRGGYDGHGVLMVDGPRCLEDGEAAAWLARTAAARQGASKSQAPAPGSAAGGSLGGAQVTSLLVEQAVPFTRELAVLLARRPSGEMVAWPVVETIQEAGVCTEVLAPAPALDPAAAAEAERIGRTVAQRFGVTGVLAVELFALEGRTGTRVLVNELAMRPHNSGHWTQDGAVTSQFAQHMRAVLDLPLGSSEPTARATVMVNLLGGERQPAPGALARAMGIDPQARIHLYGKQWRPGRKLGHVNLCLPGEPSRAPQPEEIEELRRRARAVVDILRQEDTPTDHPPRHNR